jgi:hypothetical protein
MKKLIAAYILVTLFSACGGTGGDTTTPLASSTAAEPNTISVAPDPVQPTTINCTFDSHTEARMKEANISVVGCNNNVQTEEANPTITTTNPEPTLVP